nr:hypothetical protein CFP56_22250 [Quercus suber]
MYGSTRNRGGRSRGRGGGGRSSTKSTAIKGLFKDNIWHCNCDPRLPAEHFKVKKEGKNQGRWFYTCQQQEPKRCDFFLWDEDARLRMEGAVLAGKSEETQNGGHEGWAAGRGRGGEQPSSRGLFAGAGRLGGEKERTLSPSPPPPYDSHKRTARIAGIDSDDDENFPWPLTGAEEVQLSSSANILDPKTPHKAQKSGVYATPATSSKRVLPWLQEHGPTTPATKPIQDVSYFETPSKAPITPNFADHSLPSIAGSKALMPKSPSPPARYKNALANPADAASSLTSEALAVLAPLTIPPQIVSDLRSILSKHDLRTQGVTKGRDISRLAMKAKDAKIAELHAKIASLEAEREMERGIRKLKGQGAARDNGDGGDDDFDNNEL